MTITWELSDDALASLESFRQTLTDLMVVDGRVTSEVRYSSVKEMIAATMADHLVNPALVKFPPASLAAAKKAADEARRAYEDAQAAAALGVIAST